MALICDSNPVLLSRAGLSIIGGRVYAVGGFNGSMRVRTVDVYDPTTDQWTSCASMEARRSTLGVAVLNNCIFAVSSSTDTILESDS